MAHITVSKLERSFHQVLKTHEDLLHTLLRYDIFRDSSIESPDVWITLLGPDVDSLTHPEVTVGIAKQFVKNNRIGGFSISDQEEVDVIVASWVHDWGEIIVGDITYENKSQDDEVKEMYAFNEIAKEIQNADIRRYVTDIYHTVVLNPKTRTGAMFKIIERIGYMETALRAFAGVELQKIGNWRGLAGNVLSNQIPALLESRDRYPYVGKFFREKKNSISLMIREVGSAPVPPNANDKPSYDLSRFSRAKDLWESNN